MTKPFNEHNPRTNFGSRLGFEGFHGDVTSFRLESAPKDFNEMEKIKDSAIAYGEATGHLHQIIGDPKDYDLRRCKKSGFEFLIVHNVVFLKHQEHAPVEYTPGVYRFGRQLEYDPFEKLTRQVAD